DVFVEYAKATEEDICVRIEVWNRGPEAAPIHVIPHLWYRNRWSWFPKARPEPVIELGKRRKNFITLRADDSDCHTLRNLQFEYQLGERFLYAQPGATPLFTNNETNAARVFGADAKNRTEFVKDAFHRQIVNGERCTNQANSGTKAGLHYANVLVPAGECVTFRFRLSDQVLDAPLDEVDAIVAQRKREADEFYATVHPPKASEDERRIQRQALAGLQWSKQIYLFDVHEWLNGDHPDWPPPESRKHIRNAHWQHLNSRRILSMPDKWEYPWFAAWDLAFQAVPFALVDPEFAKQQLWLLLFEQFQHPNGQLPAYEWEFSDMNPPVHAWAVWRVFNMDRIRSAKADRAWLERCFHKLLINFTWWVNKVDTDGNNVFEGGFLGLDNITVVDRSEKLPDGTVLQQSDGSGWMGMFCQNMMRIALELAKENKTYESLATKFFEHYVYIGSSMKRMGRRGYEMWDEADGFFYDVLSHPDGSYDKFRVRSLVGLIPMFAIERLEEKWIEPFKDFRGNLHWFLKHRGDLVEKCVTTIQENGDTVHVLAVMTPEQLGRLLRVVWNPAEFRSEFGLRSLSRAHESKPFHFGDKWIGYEPGESIAKLKGGNSNWRGPIWFPTSFMMIESLRKLSKAYGGTFTIPGCSPGDAPIDLNELAGGFAERLLHLFARNSEGKRPVFGAAKKFQEDPHWRDHLLFHEYFHAETGAGLGASHQTGWTALIACVIDEWRK
ncbi:MAG: glucosidase, partial [Verrucomicrobia bacterium]|nr:glucosidase [Verrucomicrobiota bacterium]